MRTSSINKVLQLYEDSDDLYDELMDAEIDLPIYADILSRLAERITGIPGPVVDTSCGSGHMLLRYHEYYDSRLELIGVDLSPRMVEISNKRLGSKARFFIGDMRNLNMISSESAAVVISFFAIHHLDPEEVATAIRE